MLPHPLRISEATAEGMTEIHRIEAAVFTNPWSPDALARELDNPHGRFWVACFDDRDGPEADAVRPPSPVGYIICHLVADEMHLLKIAVRPERRRQGVGERLLEFALERATAEGACVSFLEVRPTNRAAVRLYERVGYAPVGRRRSYYAGDGEDALILKKTIKEAV